MAALSITYPNFQSGTTIVSAQVNTNNSDIQTYINNRNSGTALWDVVSTVGAFTSTLTSNQIILGTTRTVTLTAPTPASTSRTVTLPDLSGNYSVVGDSGTQTIGGTKTFSSSIIVGGNSTGDSNYGTITSVSFGKYYEGTFTATFTGCFNSGSQTLKYVQIGRAVTLFIPAFTGTSSAGNTLNASAVIPSSIRPTTEQAFPVFIEDNNVITATPGKVRIAVNGDIEIHKANGSANFTNGNTAGLHLGATFTYQLV